MKNLAVIGVSILFGMYVFTTNKICYEVGRREGKHEAYSEITRNLKNVADEAKAKHPEMFTEHDKKWSDLYRENKLTMIKK